MAKNNNNKKTPVKETSSVRKVFIIGLIVLMIIMYVLPYTVYLFQQ